MKDDTLEETIYSLLSEHFPLAAKLERGEYFSDAGAIDSYDFFRLVSEIENRFGVSVQDEEITEANFGSVAGLASYIARHRDAGTD